MVLARDPLALTQRLLQFDTANPPGQEGACIRYLAALLQDRGFEVHVYEFGANRASLVARLAGGTDRPLLCFTGHVDTVPLGEEPWRVDPLSGETDGDLVYGRGSSDMKGGVAAIVSAGLELSTIVGRQAGVTLVLTGGEETGCLGATHLAALGDALGTAGALVVAEPTSNELFIGHKGALWLQAQTRGIAAHGSMPEEGENAIYKAAEAVGKLQAFQFGVDPHSLLGSPTLNVGTIRGGTKINIVPDRATLQVDIRTVPGRTGDQILEGLQSALGPEVALEVLLNLDAVASDPADGWIQQVISLLGECSGENPTPRGATYFTDAAVLTPAYGHPPTVILGPGEATMAHKVDEYCRIFKLRQAKEIYLAIARAWCEV